MNDSLAARKQVIRLASLARRDALDAHWRAAAARQIAERMADGLGIEADTVIAGFWPIRSEIDVRPLMAALGARGARLCLPAILDAETIEFRLWHPQQALAEPVRGIPGPGAEAPRLEPTLMLVPLAAFDGQGQRIGYGGGYYDRAIAALRARGLSPRVIGVAFDCQRVRQVPSESHDIALDEILTESGLHRVGAV